MGLEIPWIRTDEELARTIAALGEEPLALDVEGDSLHHYREQVCLVQLAFAGRVALVDPLAGVDLAGLGPALADRSRKKILHGADYDLRVLHRDFGLEVKGLFDTMIAARLAGERSFGLGALLEKHFGVKLDKSQQRADWSLRPLPETMMAYAAEDVRHLFPLASLLEAQLLELGRLAWAAEEFSRLESVRWTQDTKDPQAFRRVKGARDLDRRQLAILREVHALRDAEARQRDVPPFKVLRDEALMALARERPEKLEDLRKIPHLSHRFRTRDAERLLEAVGCGASLPAEALPETETVLRRRPDRSFEARLRQVQRKRDALAAELGIEPSVLAPKSLLESLLRRAEGAGVEPPEPGLRTWQARLIEPILH